MKVHPFWAKGTAEVGEGEESWMIACFQGSNESAKHAQEQAHERAKRVAQALADGGRHSAYEYGERSLREEIIEDLNCDGTRVVITRNAYGSLILNVERVMFIDIDLPGDDMLSRMVRRVGAWFGRGTPDPAAMAVDRIQQVLARRTELGLRLYRTTNGFRGLVTSHTFDPAKQETDDLLAEFDSDPLYRRLCRAQECFRARLTPKHWRCGCARPPARFPWEHGSEEARYREWEHQYETCCQHFSTCAFLESMGTESMSPEMQQVVQIHDTFACRSSEALA